MPWLWTLICTAALLPVAAVIVDRIRFRSFARTHPEITHIGRWTSGYSIGFRGSVAADLSRLDSGQLRVIIHFSWLQLIAIRGTNWVLDLTPADDPDHPFIARKHASGVSFYSPTPIGGHLWIYFGDSPNLEGTITGGYGHSRPTDCGSARVRPINPGEQASDRKPYPAAS